MARSVNVNKENRKANVFEIIVKAFTKINTTTNEVKPKWTMYVKRVTVDNHEQQTRQNQDENFPVLRMFSACSSILVACLFLVSSAATLFSSALHLNAANLFTSLSCTLALILSIST